jgi:hypothetical protein
LGLIDPSVARDCNPWSLANFQAVFGNLTGEDARPCSLDISRL